MTTSETYRTVRISEIRRRLEEEQGIIYYMQGGTVIKTTGSEERREAPMHYSVESVEQAVAGAAHLVLRSGEELPKRWQHHAVD